MTGGPDRRLEALAQLGTQLTGACGAEAVVVTALQSLDELLGYGHSILLVRPDPEGALVTLASRGYETGGVGSEVAFGKGVIGLAAERRQPIRVANLQRMIAYARSVQESADPSEAATEIELPGLSDARSQLAAPLLAAGELIGVLATESNQAMAFDEGDEHALALAGHLIAAALERERALDHEHEASPENVVPVEPRTPSTASRAASRLRFYGVDGSVFLDDAYLIKGVAGRLLWKLASEHAATGRTAFTNREARLDPALDLPPFRDNFESRLILLKRRLDERGAPIRVHSTGRGVFELRVEGPLELLPVDA